MEDVKIASAKIFPTYNASPGVATHTSVACVLYHAKGFLFPNGAPSLPTPFRIFPAPHVPCQALSILKRRDIVTNSIPHISCS
jgi:hypothetical protein